MENARKIVVVKMNAVSAGGSRLFWMFSKAQLELVLKDLESTPVASAAVYCQATTRWQEETLPVVSLEKYFGIFKAAASLPTKHLILKGPMREKNAVEVLNIAIPVYTEVQTGSLAAQGRSLSPKFIPENCSDILGAYELKGKRIVVIPDIYKIARNCKMLLERQNRP